MEIEMTDQTTRLPIRRALISVSDKTGILEFARELQQLGVEILSTGGTFKLLQDNGVAAVEVADYTGFAEMMDGRVKTLHRAEERRGGKECVSTRRSRWSPLK